MNQQPPYGPSHSDSGELAALQRADELYHLTQQILVLSTDPQLPELGQLILRRGQRLEQIRQLNLSGYSAETQARLNETLEACKLLDQTIEKNLYGFHSTLEQQIKGLKESKALLDKYKIPDEQQNMGTRSQDA